MSDELRAKVEAALETVRPALRADGGDIVLDRIEGEVAYVRLLGACHGCAAAQVTLSEGVEKAVRAACPEIRSVRLAETPSEGGPAHGHDHGHSHSPFERQSPVPGVKAIIAVASGKGGVGKTTVAVNLALALSRKGLAVGILDADIYGPNVPSMIGVTEAPTARGDDVIVPPLAHGVKVMSIAFFLGQSDAVIWRGPMVMRAVQQFLRDVDWSPLDVLVVDLPPGTGDAQLTLAQEVPLDGVVIVTTPSQVALDDVVRAVQMFQRVNVPLAGVVENMAYFVCPHCQKETEVFSRGGGAAMAARLGLPLLATLPLDPAVRSAGDRGRPLLVEAPEGPESRRFLELAEQVVVFLGEKVR
jgi:ATP-binding protein involved in chromosome partitioning